MTYRNKKLFKRFCTALALAVGGVAVSVVSLALLKDGTLPPLIEYACITVGMVAATVGTADLAEVIGSYKNRPARFSNSVLN